ncbi:HAD-superfamily subfamily IIA hydrolase, TIGR01458 [Methylobacillus rhizosphaerae]|uniref:Haloacid dehalogenase-like hydrolase domain-containing protein 2 n=1 Tax=Methylobacillus rhizosphaerae TaxID=551994 RepID=A0A238Z140_9PROT|nr:TIGR01458 family HAD-type hydrolase [Methylobacillus rhizosphaerae]SNR76579.1 HAD-superfamily subfamily IIA hydrolase, TIGR01458 [Methylobacillus rhizosphaerae]
MNTSSVNAILFDLDGVLHVGKSPLPGAIETIDQLRIQGISCRFVTNTSTLSRASLHKRILDMGFYVTPEEIISAPEAALKYLEQLGNPLCRFLLADDVKKDFSHFRQSNTAADYIVVGDIGKSWSYTIMNEVFNCLKQGAKLIAIHKNRFWQTEHGLQLDIGCFIDGLEYASGTEAMIIGKPSVDFFKIALADLKLPPSEVMVIGDDIDSDIDGAQKAGMRGVLVRTGKFRQEYFDTSTIKPHAVIDSIADLPGLLQLSTTAEGTPD